MCPATPKCSNHERMLSRLKQHIHGPTGDTVGSIAPLSHCSEGLGLRAWGLPNCSTEVCSIIRLSPGRHVENKHKQNALRLPTGQMKTGEKNNYRRIHVVRYKYLSTCTQFIYVLRKYKEGEEEKGRVGSESSTSLACLKSDKL